MAPSYSICPWLFDSFWFVLCKLGIFLARYNLTHLVYVNRHHIVFVVSSGDHQCLGREFLWSLMSWVLFLLQEFSDLVVDSFFSCIFVARFWKVNFLCLSQQWKMVDERNWGVLDSIYYWVRRTISCAVNTSWEIILDNIYYWIFFIIIKLRVV